MSVITTRLIVAEDGTISLVDPVPAGEYVAKIVAAPARQEATRPFRIEDLPVNDLRPIGEWPTFSREEMYGDDGR